MKIKVLIVDDHKLVRDGLIALISDQFDIELVGEACNGREALDLVQKLSPDVVVMDIAMPDLNGIDATRSIIAENTDVKVIALSMHSDKQYVVGMLKAGALGYVLKDCAFEELTKAIRVVALNRIYLCSAVNDVVIQDYMQNISSQESSPISTLTNREREITQLLAEGKTSREIASILHVSVKTIETHRQNIMEKLNIHSVAELTKYAIREGLTSIES